MAYYNENDRGAAAWLRELALAGHIAPGTVDDRSILEVRAVDLSGHGRCHFFAGIGGWDCALRLAGWPEDWPVWTGSCPCQPFSGAGKGLGEKDPRHLWPEFRRLIGECRPATVFGEQVASKAGRAWLARVRSDLEGMGYRVGAADLCAAGVGAPHIRQRLYWVADALGVRRDEPQHAGDMGGAAGTQPEHRRQDGGEGLGCTGTTCRLAHDQRPGLESRLDASVPGARGRGQGREPEQPRAADGGLAEPQDGRPEAGGGGGGRSRAARGGRANPERCRGAGGMADRDRQRLSIGAQPDGKQVGRAERSSRRADVSGCCQSERLANADGAERGQEFGPREDVRNRHDDGPPQAHGEPGACGSFWSRFVLIPCRDGKARRVEPGVEPLVAGLPRGVVYGRDSGVPFDPQATGEGRVMRLRGYGNSIVPQLAAEFIMAYMEAVGLLAKEA